VTNSPANVTDDHLFAASNRTTKLCVVAYIQLPSLLMQRFLKTAPNTATVMTSVVAMKIFRRTL
jgi:hypothetical protein